MRALFRSRLFIVAVLAMGLGTGCLTDEHLRSMRDMAQGVGVKAPAPTGGRVGARCDFSFNTRTCDRSLWCDPGDRALVKTRDGRLGIMGICRRKKTPGTRCSQSVECADQARCRKGLEGRVCTPPPEATPQESPLDGPLEVEGTG